MCNVEDFFLEYLAKTLAALPVGASNTDRFPMLGSDFTRAEINVVFLFLHILLEEKYFYFPTYLYTLLTLKVFCFARYLACEKN